MYVRGFVFSSITLIASTKRGSRHHWRLVNRRAVLGYLQCMSPDAPSAVEGCKDSRGIHLSQYHSGNSFETRVPAFVQIFYLLEYFGT